MIANPVESKTAMDVLASPNFANIQSRLNRLARPWSGKQSWDKETVKIFLGLLKPRYKSILTQEWRWWREIGFSANHYDPKMLSEAIQWFKERHVQFHWMPSLEAAVQVLKAELREYKCTQFHYSSGEDVVRNISNPSAAAGYTGDLYSRPHKSDWDGEVLLSLLKDLDSRSRKTGNYDLPALPGFRTQANGPYDKDGKRDVNSIKYKTRLIWIIDILQTLLEAQWQKPVQEQFAKLAWYAGGKSDSQISRILKEYKKWYKYSFTIDMSRFDSSIPAFMILKAFECLKVMFENDKNFDPVGWDVMVNSFINKSIYDPNTGELVKVHHGVPSGSMWTNIIDSVVNRLMMEAFFCDIGITHYGMNVMGDDNLNFSNHYCDNEFMEKMSAYYLRNFGAIVNPAKCDVNHDLSTIEYLSRSWKDSGVWRLPVKILQGLGCPERFRPYETGEADPVEIVLGYIESFPLGFKECCDPKRLDAFRLGSRKKERVMDSKYFTGLVRMQKLQKSVGELTFASTVASIPRIRHATNSMISRAA